MVMWSSGVGADIARSSPEEIRRRGRVLRPLGPEHAAVAGVEVWVRTGEE